MIEENEPVVAVVVQDEDGYHGVVEHVDESIINEASSDSLPVTLRALAAVCEGESDDFNT